MNYKVTHYIRYVWMNNLRRFNILYLICATGYIVLDNYMVSILFRRDTEGDINSFLLQNGLVKASFLVSLLFLMNLGRDHKIGKFVWFKAQGFGYNNVYALQVFTMALYGMISMLLSGILFLFLAYNKNIGSNVLNFHVPFLFLFCSLYISTTFYVMFLLTRNIILVLLLGLLIQISEIYLSLYLNNKKVITNFLYSSLIYVEENGRPNPASVIYLILLLCFAFFWLKWKKRWL